VLSNRRNIVVIADEAHRSQYGFQAGRSSHFGKTCSSLNDLSSGFALHEAAVPDADVVDETSGAEKDDLAVLIDDRPSQVLVHTIRRSNLTLQRAIRSFVHRQFYASVRSLAP